MIDIIKKSLGAYEKKRNFRSSPEPKGDSDLGGLDRPIYVIHQHNASNMHWDLRLEADGALASWAVPKGPSTDPSEKRLAIRTEDHPLHYAKFEGVIPEDQYGAGPTIIWDRGTYSVPDKIRKDHDTDDDAKILSALLEDGKVEFVLKGEKLAGGYALVHMQGDDDEQWLLIKTDDDEADARRNPVSTEPKSVVSERTIDELQEKDNES